jgi:hypothetical protein
MNEEHVASGSTEPDAESVTFNGVVKGLFDHLRNLGICGGVLYAGRHILLNAAMFDARTGDLANELGTIVMIIGTVLLLICAVQFAITVGAYIPEDCGPRTNSFVPSLLITCFFYLPLLVATVLVTALRDR